jgi:Fe-S-cluster containining protein
VTDAPSVVPTNRPTGGNVESQFVTLEQARAMECNGCGDCCDSRRTNGYWTWGVLPEQQYRELTSGDALIIPLQLVGEQWVERDFQPEDAHELTPTRFRCAALEEQPDGRALCGRHLEERPPRCGEFPVWGPDIEPDIAEHGELWLPTDSLVRCTWYRVCVVADDDPRLGTAAGAGQGEPLVS